MKKIIIANWKMQLSLKESLVLARGYVKKLNLQKNEIVVCPDYAALAFLAPIFKNTNIVLGAQDCAFSAKGAYTGEVSPLNIQSLGAKYVILGHSERREYLKEDSVLINQKIKVALENKLVPVFCIGERLAEKRAGKTKKYLLQELRQGLKGLKIKTANDLIIAYEPVWAISTNKGAKPISCSEADEIQKFIKEQAQKILQKKVRVLYGGSVKAENAADFLAQAHIDGLLVGGASLQVKDFSIITN